MNALRNYVYGPGKMQPIDAAIEKYKERKNLEWSPRQETDNWKRYALRRRPELAGTPSPHPRKLVYTVGATQAACQPGLGTGSLSMTDNGWRGTGLRYLSACMWRV